MRHYTPAITLCAAALLGCTKTEKPPADAPGATMTAPATAALSAAAVAGDWNMTATAAGTGSTVTFVFNASGDPSTWTFTFPGRPPVPVSVSFDGDSMMTSAGPYESVLRPGVQVTTNSVMRLQGGKVIGATTARYAGAGADSVVQLTSEGTRAP